MANASIHIDKLKAGLAESRISRREFVRYAALLGMSAAAAYATAGLIPGITPLARAQDLPKGGTLRLGSRVKDIKSRTPIPGARGTATSRARWSNI